MNYCDKCALSESDVSDILYTCKCVKKEKNYDLDKALSEIEKFFHDNNFRGVDDGFVVYMANKDNSN
jgi:hypothetical protein